MIVSLDIPGFAPHLVAITMLPAVGQFIFPYRQNEKGKYVPVTDSTRIWGYKVLSVRPPTSRDGRYTVKAIARFV